MAVTEHVYLVSKQTEGTAMLEMNYSGATWLGALQRKKIQKIRDYYGSGWVGLDFFFFWENRPKIALNQY